MAPVPVRHVFLQGADKEMRSPNIFWGRRKHVSAFSGLLSLGLVVGSIFLTLFLHISLEHFGGSIWVSITEPLFVQSPLVFILRYLPAVSTGPVLGYAGWVAVQAMLYTVVPGKVVHGPPTPGGHSHAYLINGLLCWFLTLCCFALAGYLGGVSVIASVARDWGALLVVANIYGLITAVLAYVKAHVSPTFGRDRRFSAFMAKQYETFGSISNSMVAVTLFHAIYTIDFFANEDWYLPLTNAAWYLSTIDIALDHFGFCLGWGPAAWLPMIYTCQAQYLALYPTQLPWGIFSILLTAGLAGYILFRLSNYEKQILRGSGSNHFIESRQRVIRAQYATGSGDVHESQLLYSGCWGIVRHPNYVGDIIFSFCTCLTCGWNHILPYIYFIYMTCLLVHRSHRDEKRCSTKYGAYWEEYKRLVPWRMVPGIF
ncbi:ergosterol biosynthesis ERG4/ERG24 family-domain-containing protein [Aspergillus floccosus]